MQRNLNIEQYISFNKTLNEEPVLFRKERHIFFRLIEQELLDIGPILKRNQTVQYLTNKYGYLVLIGELHCTKFEP